ncbi:MAG: hypothetical protein JO092_12470 [Candidatus Eremiobacteraeota bacterium]|nr:hypothetical protein [Candidatus Eremiobacteraeota bacterium]
MKRVLHGLAFLLAVAAWPGCAGSAPSPSHVSGAYRGRLPDDILVEAATTVLVTKRDVVIALDCRPLEKAVMLGDSATIDRAVSIGVAARLPSGVTIYTPPFSARNPEASPLVVTDDKYAGTLCTPSSVEVLRRS